MTWSSAIDAQVRAGRAPDDAVIEEVARTEAVRLGSAGALRRSGQLRADLMGLGTLEPLVEDEAVTDVLVNGDGSVWVDRGAGVVAAGVELDGPEAVRRLATRLSAVAGRRLDDAQPWVDGLLPRGIRLHAVLPPLVAGGAHLSLRIPRHRGGGLDALVTLGMASAGQAARLREIVHGRQAYVVTGGTGTGKTTLLAALLAEVPAVAARKAFLSPLVSNIMAREKSTGASLMPATAHRPTKITSIRPVSSKLPSGLLSRASSRSSGPGATTVRSGWLSMIMRNPARTIAWSSTMTSVIGTGCTLPFCIRRICI